MLWAALFFPQLLIDMHAAGQHDEQPLAVVAQQGARRLLVSANATARAAGIRPGLTLNSAYAIVPGLQIIEYDEQAQQSCLEHLCLWALQYSSWITPRMPDLVLVEIGASLSLFDGLQSLLTRMRDDLKSQKLQCQIGIAPGAAAASLFARVGGRTGVLKAQRLRPVLGEIPIDPLPLDAGTIKGLRQSGIKLCGQLFDLPAPALNRRFGRSCSELIHQLLGRLPEVCPAFTAPETFSRSLDLPLEVHDTTALQFPLNRLLSALGGFLQSADLGIKKLTVTLEHHRLSATQIDIGFLEASASHRHLFRVICEKLDNTRLAAPVRSLSISSSELAPVNRNDRDLFRKSQSQQSSIEQLIDSLTARLGSDKLYTPMLNDDHRPEKAWCAELLHNEAPPAGWPSRPLWLLPEPQPASRSLANSLTIRSTAERIENGWWGDEDVRRDYYIAADGHGAHYWVFTQRASPDALFIHGIFS